MHAKTPHDFSNDFNRESAPQDNEPEEWAPNDPVDPVWEAAWDKEFDRRWAEYEAGLVELIPHEEVFAAVAEGPGE